MTTEVIIGRIYKHDKLGHKLAVFFAEQNRAVTLSGLDGNGKPVRRGFILFWEGTWQEFCEQWTLEAKDSYPECATVARLLDGAKKGGA